MKKQHIKKNTSIKQYCIPLAKNKLQRTHFYNKLHQWLIQKLPTIPNDITTNNSQQPNHNINQKCKQLQNQFHLKYNIQPIILHLPINYYQTLIQYVMQKKLHWVFKTLNTNQRSTQTHHHQLQVNLVLQLKTYYKHFQYQHSNQIQTSPTRKTKQSSNDQSLDSSFNSHRKTMYKSFKKHNFDFTYELLIMFSVCIVASFFQYFFPQLEIDNNFKAEIYIIINHAFLDMEISQSVFTIMAKKFCNNQLQKNFKSLNTTYMFESSIFQQKRVQNRQQSIQNDSKRSINQQNKMKSTLTTNKDLIIKVDRAQSKQHQIKRMQSTGFNNVLSKSLNSTTGFSNTNLNKTLNKKDIFIKPTTSIGSCIPSDRMFRQDSKGMNNSNMNYSRFNSFIKDTKQLSIPPQIQNALGHGYLPTNEQIDFYSTIKQCLHVDSLPPIMKKKMNINQYQKLNQVEKVKNIRKQVKALDQVSKKNHIKSNDLSLAMNTFISFSCNFSKKKRNQKSSKIVANYLQNGINRQSRDKKRQNHYSFDQSDNKQNFQLRKLPLKAANLKLQLNKSSNLYAFNDEVLNICIEPQQKNQFKLSSHLILSSRKTHEPQKLTNEQDSKIKQLQANFQQKTKKSTTQWKQFIHLLKTTHNHGQIMTFRQSDKKQQKKRYLDKQGIFRQRQNDLNSSLNIIKSQIASVASMKSNKQTGKTSSNLMRTRQPRFVDNQDNKQMQRQSIFGDLSSKLQIYELGTKDMTQIQLVNENTNRNQDCSKYASLEGQVNVHKDVSMNYKSQYKSFELKKKLKNFEYDCKKREDISNYSIFNIKTYKDPVQQSIKDLKQEQMRQQQNNNRKQQIQI